MIFSCLPSVAACLGLTAAFLAVPQARGTCLRLWATLKTWNSFPLELRNVDRLLFFTVEKHEIIAALAGVGIHLTVKLPLCFTVRYVPFLCAAVLCILQLTV